MDKLGYSIQPTVEELLACGVFAEAQLLVGKEYLERPVSLVVDNVYQQIKPGALLAIPPQNLSELNLSELSAVVFIQELPPASAEEKSLKGEFSKENAGRTATTIIKGSEADQSGTRMSKKASDTNLQELEIKRAALLCQENEIPLLIIPPMENVHVIQEEIRHVFLTEVKRKQGVLFSALLSSVVDFGLAKLVNDLSDMLDRPVVIESADFKVLSGKNMGSTPDSQRQNLLDEISAAFGKIDEKDLSSLIISPIKLGRRLAVPVILQKQVVGYLSCAHRSRDDIDYIGEYLQAAALASMVDFSQRRRELYLTMATERGLLKDLLSGRSLSSSEAGRLEQHFGFDRCDGIVVLAFEIKEGELKEEKFWPNSPYVLGDVEGTRVLVFSFQDKPNQSFNDVCVQAVEFFKNQSTDLKLQVGISRKKPNILELADAYREARQSLIIGSMLEKDKEFVLDYARLGVKRLLYLAIDHPEIDLFLEENLAPLEAYDLEWETDLVPTLRVYLEHGANLNSAARALFIHRHTLRYRLEQIADILNMDIESQEVLLNLQIAFLIRDLKGTGES